MSSKKQKDQSLLINTRNSLEKKVKIKLEELYETIKKHDIAYYENHNPTISDAEYDEIRRLILEIEKDYFTIFDTIKSLYKIIIYKRIYENPDLNIEKKLIKTLKKLFGNITGFPGILFSEQARIIF